MSMVRILNNSLIGWMLKRLMNRYTSVTPTRIGQNVVWHLRFGIFRLGSIAGKRSGTDFSPFVLAETLKSKFLKLSCRFYMRKPFKQILQTGCSQFLQIS